MGNRPTIADVMPNVRDIVEHFVLLDQSIPGIEPDYLALVGDKDTVAILDDRQAMCDHQGRVVFWQCVMRRNYCLLGSTTGRARDLVEHEHAGMLVKYTSEPNAVAQHTCELDA